MAFGLSTQAVFKNSKCRRILLLQFATFAIHIIYRVGQTDKPLYCCNNFVYCQPAFLIFDTCTLSSMFATGGYYS